MVKRLALLSQIRGPGQWWLFLRVLAFATAVPLLFTLRISVLSRLLERRLKSACRLGNDAAAQERIVRFVDLASTIGRPLVRPRCLVRGVTLYYFLRRAGLDLALCFGAASKQGRLLEAAGHCWLTREGEPFLEERDPRASFVPIYWLPEAWSGAGNAKPLRNVT